MTTLNAWHKTPLRTRLLFLLAVFFVFATFGFAIDASNLGQQSLQRLAFSVVISALFSVAYAASGLTLRRAFWKAAVPIFIVQFACMGLIGHWYPEPHVPSHLDTAATALLLSRLRLDGSAILISVGLGYAGFVYVSVSEARRYVATEALKASLESEMTAAREVQRMMVPRELPRIDGYAIESVYRPAAEVGGDFFQVIPLRSGRTLVVIGDVSGKGLRAAMIVSSLVGMFWTVSDFTEEPAEILNELNRLLCPRTHDGFVTCQVVRLDDAGTITLANAGHLPPYLNGQEIPISGSLPLGLADAAVYEEMAFALHGDDVLTLLTDGIVEAQNQDKVLLGFPRVALLLREGANADRLAGVAQQHGQNDDLTVISIARTGVIAAQTA